MSSVNQDWLARQSLGGSVNVKVEPHPTSLCTQISPPWISMTSGEDQPEARALYLHAETLQTHSEQDFGAKGAAGRGELQSVIRDGLA